MHKKLAMMLCEDDNSTFTLSALRACLSIDDFITLVGCKNVMYWTFKRKYSTTILIKHTMLITTRIVFVVFFCYGKKLDGNILILGNAIGLVTVFAIFI
mmetsp:Transcript_38125/g.44393  ORF Transcript_38125/g.44393 Transcript_38125/m.44393 type:complete len:99 (-) Transcript_38125:1800-2096(-)